MDAFQCFAIFKVEAMAARRPRVPCVKPSTIPAFSTFVVGIRVSFQCSLGRGRGRLVVASSISDRSKHLLSFIQDLLAALSLDHPVNGALARKRGPCNIATR